MAVKKASRSARFGKFLGEACQVALAGAIVYYVFLPIGGLFVGHLYKTSYYTNYCDARPCVREGFGYRPADEEAKIADSHRRNAPTFCPGYLNGSTWEQWVSMRDLAWCENYPEYAGK